MPEDKAGRTATQNAAAQDPVAGASPGASETNATQGQRKVVELTQHEDGDEEVREGLLATLQQALDAAASAHEDSSDNAIMDGATSAADQKEQGEVLMIPDHERDQGAKDNSTIESTQAPEDQLMSTEVDLAGDNGDDEDMPPVFTPLCSAKQQRSQQRRQCLPIQQLAQVLRVDRCQRRLSCTPLRTQR